MIRRFPFGLVLGLVFVTGALFVSRAADAAVIYGDIAGDSVFSGYNLGPSGGLNNAIAEGFKMTGAYNLNSVDLILSNFTPVAGSNFLLSIYSDAGNQPGVDLYDLSTNVIGTTSSTPTQATFSGTGSFLLNAGTTYWLDLYVSNPASSTGSGVEWDGEFTQNFSAFAIPSGVGATEVGQERSVGGGNPPVAPPRTSELRTAFQLNGTAVPEPSSMALVAIASAVAVICASKRHREAKGRSFEFTTPTRC